MATELIPDDEVEVGQMKKGNQRVRGALAKLWRHDKPPKAGRPMEYQDSNLFLSLPTSIFHLPFQNSLAAILSFTLL